MKKNLNTIVMACLLIVGINSFAQAHFNHTPTCADDGSIVLRDSNTSSGYYLDGTGSNDLKLQTGSGGYNITTGTLNLDVRNSDSPFWVNFQAYCIEKDQSIKFGTNLPDTTGHAYDVVNLADYSGINSTEVGFLGKLWANAFDLSTTGDVEAAAFQALVWETVYDDTMDLDDDNFNLYRTNSFTQDAFDLANDWIDNINNNIWTDTVDLYVMTDGCSQDFITTVPEPSSMALALVGGVMLLGRRRRERIA
jgi:hypothetical protein